jgi:hypothetical protein
LRNTTINLRITGVPTGTGTEHLTITGDQSVRSETAHPVGELHATVDAELSGPWCYRCCRKKERGFQVFQAE